MAEKKRVFASDALASLPSFQSVLGEIPLPNPPRKEKSAPQGKREGKKKA